MKQIVFALGRFVTISLASLGFATFANWRNHHGYWNGTIHRVQSTDFNLLAHTLPTKLSYALSDNNFAEVERTLDSNYGLFGLVVTNCYTTEINCPNQQIIFSTNSNREWKKQLSIETLTNAPYSILRNPPPVLTEERVVSPRDPRWEKTGEINSGQIIGRVYYVRGIPPKFLADYQRWIAGFPNNFWSDSGAFKYYSLTVGLFGLGGLAAFIFIEMICHYKRIEKRHLLAQLEQSHQGVREQLNQISCLISEKEQFLQELSAYQQREGQTAQTLKEMLKYTESQFVQQKQQARDLEKTIAALQEENEQNKQTVAALQDQLSQAQQNQNNVEILRQELEAVQKRKQQIEEQCQDYKCRVDNLQAEATELVERLRTQAEEAERREREADLKRQEMDKGISELREKNYQERADDLKLLEERIAKLREEEAAYTVLNEFERTILKSLNSSPKCQTRQWLVYNQFDVSQQGKPRQVTDFILISQSCVFILEAKFYLGEVSAEGDVRNTPWICQTATGKTCIVKSSGGENPYKQVVGYTDRMRARIELGRTRSRIGVYGIIVFPEGADLCQLQSEIGDYYRVITLDKLIHVVQELEFNFIQQNQHLLTPLSVEQLDNLIHGRPIKREARSSKNNQTTNF